MLVGDVVEDAFEALELVEQNIVVLLVEEDEHAVVDGLEVVDGNLEFLLQGLDELVVHLDVLVAHLVGLGTALGFGDLLEQSLGVLGQILLEDFQDDHGKVIGKATDLEFVEQRGGVLGVLLEHFPEPVGGRCLEAGFELVQGLHVGAHRGRARARGVGLELGKILEALVGLQAGTGQVGDQTGGLGGQKSRTFGEESLEGFRRKQRVQNGLCGFVEVGEKGLQHGVKG